MCLAGESLMLLLILVSILLKANAWSFVYMLFVLYAAISRDKTQVLLKANLYISFFLIIQYLLFLSNLTASTSPAPFPQGFYAYPKNNDDPSNMETRFIVPVFFQYDFFRNNLRLCYALGIGIDSHQIRNILVDFLINYLISMYILNSKNPILQK